MYRMLKVSAELPSAVSRQVFDLVSHLRAFDKRASTLEEARRAVVLLRVVTAKGEERSGTGFVISSEGYVLSAYHVVQGASSVEVSFEAGADRWIRAHLLGWDEEVDLAVLRLAEAQRYPCVAMAEAGYRPVLGEEIGVLGYPLGEALGRAITFTKGTVNGLRHLGKVAYIQIDAVAAHGSSGAPVFRLRDLRVIGWIHGGVRPELGAGINLAVSVEEIHRRFGSGELRAGVPGAQRRKGETKDA